MHKQAGNYCTGIMLSHRQQLYYDESHGTWRPLCPHKSTAHLNVASGSPFEMCLSPDATPCASQQSTYTERLTRGKRAGIPQSWKVSLVSAGGVGQSLQACLDLSKACSSYTQVLCTRHMMNHTDRHPHHQWYLLVFVQEMAYDNEHVQKTLSSLPVHTQYSLPHSEISMTAWWNLPFYGSWPFI